jgi:putative inorganic carbon (HCO3(-)) transporter
MSETWQVAGCVAAAAAVGVVLLAANRRIRAAGLLAAMAIALALVAGEGWDELHSLRESPASFAAAIAAAAGALAGLAAILLRWPLLLPLALFMALPFRIPIGVGGGEDVNLLVPLYAVLGGGVLAEAIAALRSDQAASVRCPRPLALALLAAVGLYAIQASYSNDVGFAARNTGFFLIPFAVMFSLLAEVRWTPRLLVLTFAVVLGEALLFAAVGIGQHIAGEIFWNEALEMSNDFHFYLRVNSLFWDPNIYGRYLALAIVFSLGVLVWLEDRRRALALAGAIAVVFAGLCVAFSQSSFISLLAGIAALAALRWSLLWTTIATPLIAAVAVAGLLTIGSGAESEEPVGIETEGRATLIAGGIDLAQERPLYGQGSASFPEAFAEAEDVKKGENTVSHNEPVTVAAEQGAIGLLAYLALLAVAAWTLLSGMRRIAPGFGGTPPTEGGERAITAARLAIAAAFGALLVHTIGYAGYLTDPLTWALLAAGAALSVQTGVAPSVPSRSATPNETGRSSDTKRVAPSEHPPESERSRIK